MKLKNIIFSSVFISLLLLGSCEQSLSPISSIDSPEIESTKNNSIGIKLENPYTVESILRARDNLKVQGVLACDLTDDKFKPTHYYIRFKPETVEEYLEINQNSGLMLWDFPLDYKFPEGMIKYRDPEIPRDRPNYLYTAVKVDQELISDNYEIIAELILAPEDEEEVQAKRSDSFNKDLFDNYHLLEYESLRITGNLPESTKRGKWRPKGKIEVWDEVLQDTVPVVSVNVRTKNWFRWWDGYTDSNGNFSCPKKYIGDISYSLRWQYPNNRFDIRSGERGQAYYNGPNRKRGAWNLKILSGMSLRYAHIFRAGSFYVGQEPFGLNDRPFDYISIKAIDGNSPKAHLSLHEARKSDIRIYRKWNFGTPYSSQDLFFLTAHELGHAHHEEIYDGKFKDITREVKEAWACAMAYYMTSSVYNLSINRAPFYTRQDWSYWEEGNYNSPMIIDMVDDYNQRSNNADYIEDLITGYTLKQIESIIAKGGCKKIKDFENEIKALPRHRNVTRKMLDRYFSQYK